MAKLPDGVVVPRVDFPVEQLTVVVLFDGPRRDGYSQETAQRLADEHVRYTIGLAEEGHLLHAGALIDAGSAPKLSGLGFSRLTQDQLRPLIEKDPAVIAGKETFRLVAHAFPKGGLTFAREAAEHA